jgi:carboxylesterase type B
MHTIDHMLTQVRIPTASVNLHLLRGEPLFSRAILQSGLAPLCGIMNPEEYQIIYEKTLQVLGIEMSLSREQRLACLMESDASSLAASMVDVFIAPVITLAPCDDHSFIPGPIPTYSGYLDFKIPEWCKDVMIGDAKHECIIWNKAYRHLTASDLIARSEESVELDAAKKILSVYNINANLSSVDTFYAIEKLTTDGMYLAMNYDATRAQPDCFAYHFDEPSYYDTD